MNMTQETVLSGHAGAAVATIPTEALALSF